MPRCSRLWAWRRVATDRWALANQAYLLANRQANDAAKGLGAITKAIRAAIQSAMLAVGAYLVIKGEATGGIIIASSILTARALAPVEMSIASWKGFTQARQSWDRLAQLLSFIPPEPRAMALPAPTKMLTVEAASVAAPGGETLVVADASLSSPRRVRDCASSAPVPRASLLSPGCWLASGSPHGARFGWTELPWNNGLRPSSASISAICPRTFNSSPGLWPRILLGLRWTEDPGAIIKAAQAAGVHEMILRLPNGYETQIGEGGQAYRPGSASVSAWPGHFMVSRSSWCSTSPMPTSMPTGTRL